MTSETVELPIQFNGQGHFHAYFIDSQYPRKIEVDFGSSIVLSEIVFEMPHNKAPKKISISVLEQIIAWPDKWTYIDDEVHKKRNLIKSIYLQYSSF